MRGGVANSTRYIPIHTLAQRLGIDVCKVLPAVHTLTGCDTTSKVGTKAAALKVNPTLYLKDFGKNMQTDIDKAEEYLVQVVKAGTQLKTMDALRYHLYHRSKNLAYHDLPATSRSIALHIQRSLYATYIQINCLKNPTLDPCQYGYGYCNELLVAYKGMELLPDDLPQACTCPKCATQRCICRQNKVACCVYCKCRGEFLDGRHCKNPHVVLKVPVTMPPSIPHM